MKHIEKNSDEVANWFVEYCNKRYQGYLGPIPQLNLFQTFKEKSNLLLAYIDLWNKNDSEKIIYLDKVYSALHAKKFKEKPKNQKGEHFWLGPDQMRMLNEIAIRKKLSRKDTLHSIVQESYLKLLK